jgi:hypothetical protein
VTRTMYDSVDVTSIPRNAQMVAGYVDGHWPTFGTLASGFPKARLVSIAISASEYSANVLDVEKGDADASQAPGWATEVRKAGRVPTVYTDSANWDTVRNAFTAAHVEQPYYWIAHYGVAPVPPPGAIALQYENTTGYDVSVVADYWPGVDPEPEPTPVATTVEEDPMFIAVINRDTVPKDVSWPGDFLLTSAGTLKHITPGDNLTAFQNAGVRSLTIDYTQYLELIAA